jgi:predicted PurR-regulated permease PerM
MTIVIIWVGIAAIVVVTVLQAVLVTQLKRTGAEIERLAHTVNVDLLPRAERILEKSEAEMAEVRAVTESLHRITDSADQIVEAVGEFVGRTRDSVEPVIAAVGTIGRPIRQGAAIWTGVRAGLDVLRRRGDGARRPR